MSTSETSSSSTDSSGTETNSHDSSEDQSPRSSEDRSPRPKRVKVSDGGDIVVAGNGFEQEPLAGLVIFKPEVLDGLVEYKDLGVSFEEFPYYLSDTTKTALVSASVHLKCKEFAKFTPGFTCLSPKILLSGPAGSQVYQEELAKALANHSVANLLTFDGREVLGALSAAEIQSRKLQTLELIDSQQSSDKSAGEGDASSPSDASDSQLTLMKAPLTPTFRAGDRVRFHCPLALSISRGPSHGSKGTVVLGCGDNPSSKVGVRFDEPIPDGVDLNRQCEEGRGFLCSAVDLLSDSSGSEDLDELLINTLFEVVRDASRSCPLVLFLKDAEKFVAGNSGLYTAFQRGLEHLPENVIVICSHTHPDNPKEEDTRRQAPVSTKRLPLPLLLESTVSINSQQNIGRQVPEAAKRLTKLFENDVSIECPQDENLLTVWNNQLDHDSEVLQMRANTKQLHMMLRRSGFVCEGFDEHCVKNLTIDTEDAENIIGWALSHHATAPDAQSLSLDSSSMDFGIRLLKARRIESAFSKKYREEIAAGKEFRERLSSDLITPKNISEKFDDIGAIKDVKEAFVEHVVVPFKLPHVTEPLHKGILLYGPTGTGKTTLARAVAVEADANLITISMSTITSSNKSIDELDKYVQALFSVASKNAPSIIFVDEVDKVLGQRVNQEIKNIFIKHWRGLLNRPKELVLFLAATNRPFELEESVNGQFCHRIMIELPDGKSRSEILKTILRTTKVSDDVDLIQLGNMANGYSGKDIKKLCAAAANRRALEIYNKRERGSALGAEDTKPPAGGGSNDLRPLNMQDFLDALKQMGPSISPTSESIRALLEWSTRQGGGGSKDNDLGYFL